MKHKFSYTSLISFVVLILFNIASSKVQAQFTERSYPFNTHYFFHMYPINPAYIGVDGEANVGLAYKKANGFFQTAGNRAFAYVHGKSEALQGGGFGVLFNYMDANLQGIEHTQMSLGASATYNQNLMDLVDVKIGITTSFLRYTNNRVITTAPGSQSTIQRFAKLNLDAGLLLALADFELGFAMHHNNEPQFQFFTMGPQSQFNREFYITASYNWAINDDFSIEPQIIAQQNSRDQDLLFQATILAGFQDMVFAGFSLLGDFDTRRNQLSPYTTREFHKIRLTAAGKFAEQFLIAASVDFPTIDNFNRNVQFEASLGYYFNRDDY